MYKVIGTVKSRALRVLWMLNELGVPYEHIAVGPRSPEVTALNPAGKVPVLIEDGTAITDSVAIIQYLADKHGTLTYPAGTLDRARQDSFTNFILDEIEAPLWMAARHTFILPEDRRLPAIKDSLRWEFERSQITLAARMEDAPYLMGARFTVPDILLTHCLIWAKSAGFPVLEEKLVDYAAMISARDGLKSALAQ